VRLQRPGAAGPPAPPSLLRHITLSPRRAARVVSDALGLDHAFALRDAMAPLVEALAEAREDATKEEAQLSMSAGGGGGCSSSSPPEEAAASRGAPEPLRCASDASAASSDDAPRVHLDVSTSDSNVMPPRDESGAHL